MANEVQTIGVQPWYSVSLGNALRIKRTKGLHLSDAFVPSRNQVWTLRHQQQNKIYNQVWNHSKPLDTFNTSIYHVKHLETHNLWHSQLMSVQRGHSFTHGQIIFSLVGAVPAVCGENEELWWRPSAQCLSRPCEAWHSRMCILLAKFKTVQKNLTNWKRNPFNSIIRSHDQHDSTKEKLC